MAQKRSPNLSPLFFIKWFSMGACCLWLGAALSACSSSPEETTNLLEGVYIVSFDKNGGDTEANPQSKVVEPPITTVDVLPQAPTREGHRFMGWNTEADGSGQPFTAHTLVRESLTVYAQWELRFGVEVSPVSKMLTPIMNGAYSERSTSFAVVVSGFNSEDDKDSTRLSITPMEEGLSIEVNDYSTAQSKVFNINVVYDGTTAFPSGSATLRLALSVPSSYGYGGETTTIAIRDGQEKNRAIPVGRANIEAFNAYANTADGRILHYRLSGNIVLPPPVNLLNWTPIGNTSTPFMGSFEGNNFSISGLSIHAESSSYQGLFGAIGQDAEIANLGLLDLNVTGYGYVGALVGRNAGTVHNCSATGNIVGSGSNVGGLVGYNANTATVQNSYATGSVNSSATGSVYVGGLVGNNYGTVQNSYATGSVNSSGNYVGGLVGNHYGTVQNSYATGNVEGNSRVGGLVGINYSSVQNSYATGSVNSSGNYVGGLVGRNFNPGTIHDSLALNPRVIGTADVGRVTGESTAADSLSGNYAFSGMRNSAGNTTWPNIGGNNIDGAQRTAVVLQAASGFPGTFSSTPWTYAAGRLPGLFGQTVAMPEHLLP